MTLGFRSNLVSLSLAATGPSQPIDLSGVMSTDLIFDSAIGDHAGAIKVQKSSDGETWRDVPLLNKTTGAMDASVAVSAGVAVATDYELSCAARFIRFYYTLSSGGAAQVCTIAVHSKRSGSFIGTSIGAIAAGLAKESGGHLEETADHVHSIDAKLPDAKTDWTGTGLAKEATALLIRKAIAPTLGTVVYISVSGTAAASAALAAGTYQLSCDVATWYRVNAAVGGTDAAVETAPAKLLMAGQTVQVAVGTDGCIETITSGGSGVLGYELVS